MWSEDVYIALFLLLLQSFKVERKLKHSYVWGSKSRKIRLHANLFQVLTFDLNIV